MSADELGLLLRFVTSVSRAPLGGFRHLAPPLTIHRVPCDASPFAAVGARDVDRLPSASTCFNLLARSAGSGRGHAPQPAGARARGQGMAAVSLAGACTAGAAAVRVTPGSRGSCGA